MDLAIQKYAARDFGEFAVIGQKIVTAADVAIERIAAKEICADEEGDEIENRNEVDKLCVFGKGMGVKHKISLAKLVTGANSWAEYVMKCYQRMHAKSANCSAF